MESDTAFTLVIGLSIEDPKIKRTTVKEDFDCGQSLGLTLPKTGFIIHTKKSSGRLKGAWLLQKDAKAMPLLSAAYFGDRQSKNENLHLFKTKVK